jgi:hypothetical protein
VPVMVSDESATAQIVYAMRRAPAARPAVRPAEANG